MVGTAVHPTESILECISQHLMVHFVSDVCCMRILKDHTLHALDAMGMERKHVASQRDHNILSLSNSWSNSSVVAMRRAGAERAWSQIVGYRRSILLSVDNVERNCQCLQMIAEAL